MTTNVATLIRTLSDSAVKRTDVINAVVARELILTGLNPSGTYKVTAVSTATGVDKGDVSRIGKILATLDVKVQRKIKSLDISVINADDTDTLAAASALGAAFRRTKSTPAPRASAPEGDAPEGEATVSGATSEPTVDVDPAAILHGWLTEDGLTDAQYAGRVSIVESILANVAAERATAAA